MCFAGLVRMSFEVRADTGVGDVLHVDMVADVEATRVAKRAVVLTGRDIKGREEQEKDVRRFVESRGGRYVFTYEEPDTSAWKRRRVREPDGRIVYRVVRPVFQGMLADLTRGTAPNGEQLDGVIVGDIDRLTRELRTLEDAIDAVELARRPIIDLSGSLDLLTQAGRDVARFLVTAKGAESAAIARRVERKHHALQQAGIPVGGRRPYGWNEDKRTLREAEAREVRKAVERLLSGASLSSIVGDWRARGVVTAEGRVWTLQTLKAKLRDPRLCGYRARRVTDFDPATGRESRHIDIVHDDNGEPVIGQWEPIISVEQWRALVDIIGANPEPARYHGGGLNSRTYLLSGTLRCGKPGCGQKLRGSKSPPSKGRPEGHFDYTCPQNKGGRGCGGIRIDGPMTDQWVTLAVIEKYESEAAQRNAQVVPQEWEGAAELKRVQDLIAEHREARELGIITKERYFAFLAEDEAKEGALLAQRKAWRRAAQAARGKPVNLRADWDDLSLPEKRSYIESAFVAVVVSPAAHSGRAIGDRLDPIPRTGD